MLKKYDLLPSSGVSKWCPRAKKYDLLQLKVSKWCPSAWEVRFVDVVCGFEVVFQRLEVRYVAVVWGFKVVSPC